MKLAEQCKVWIGGSKWTSTYTRLAELSMLIVMLFARSSIALGKLSFRHIQGGFVNRLFEIFVNLSLPSSQPMIWPLPGAFDESFEAMPSIAAAACRHGTGPFCPIPMALSPFH